MKNILICITLGCFALTMGACSKDDATEVVNNLTEDPELNGRFQSECLSSDLIDFSYQEILEFGGNQFTQTRKYFSNVDCKSDFLAGKYSLKGEFIVNADENSKTNLGQIEIEFNEATVTPYRDNLVEALDAIEFCAIEGFEIDKTSIIPKKASNEITCPINNFDTNVYGTYKLNEDELLLNEGGIEAMSPSKKERPRSLEEENVYTRS